MKTIIVRCVSPAKYEGTYRRLMAGGLTTATMLHGDKSRIRQMRQAGVAIVAHEAESFGANRVRCASYHLGTPSIVKFKQAGRPGNGGPKSQKPRPLDPAARRFLYGR